MSCRRRSPLSRSARAPSALGLALALLAPLCLGACEVGGEDLRRDPGLVGLAITAVAPGTVVPGSVIVIDGSSFVDLEWGVTRLVLEGTLSGSATEVAFPAQFIDFTQMIIPVDGSFFAALGQEEGDFIGTATLQVDSLADGRTYESEPLGITLEVRRTLEPSLDEVATGQLIYVNDKIEVSGSGFLLGGDEGDTVVSVAGCFTAVGDSTCVPTGDVEVTLETSNFDRTRGTFAFAPTIAGIRPGEFSGTVLLRNRHAGGQVTQGELAPVAHTILEPTIFELGQSQVSLGQYLDIQGGGFVGGEDGGVTFIELDGTLTTEGGVESATYTLVPEWKEGRLLRYVLSEDDSVGQAIDLRLTQGTLAGTMRPVVQYESDEVVGPEAPITLELASVRQVVHLVFMPSYVESLRHFGLRAVDSMIRQRIVEVVKRDYRTINLDVRTEVPLDFALYSTVEISGPDLNGIGLLGYDNTPGKDTGNLRLYDRIGGINATTQQDGFPGYGGVFIESMFSFSMDPGGFAEGTAQADPVFDEVMDPFRPDHNGEPATSSDLVAGVESRSNSDGCPASQRQDQLSCAVFVLGSLIGTTLSHEIGHSLGLASPYEMRNFHNQGDAPNRLMDDGGARPLYERAELFGEGPANFCTEEYDYLRVILPTDEPADPTERPPCM